MIFLKQSTASQEIPIGYFLDSTDGNTEETALSIANTDLKLWKTGATTVTAKNSGGAIHMASGLYYTVLDATDTDTLGPLTVFCHPTGALAAKVDCCVLSANVYDSLIGATDFLKASVTTITSVTGNVAGSVGSVTGNVGGNVTGSVGSVLGNILGTIATVTNMVSANVIQISGDSTAADNEEKFFDGTGYNCVNNVFPTVTNVVNLINAPTTGDFTSTMKSSLAATTITGVTNGVTITTNNDKTGYALTAAGIDSILDEVVDNTITLRQAIKLVLSSIAGKASGGGTTSIAFRDIGDSLDRITMTVDSNGNRSAVTLNVT